MREKHEPGKGVAMSTSSAPRSFAPSDNVIPRERLMRLSPLRTSKKLTALVAPAGFGKTVLMTQWAEQASIEGVSTLWYKVSAGDNREGALFANFLALLKNVLWLKDSSPHQVQAGVDPESIEQVAELISRDPRKHIFFIDKLERLQAAHAVAVLNSLIEFSGQSLFFVIASNTEGIVPLSSYRAHNQLLHVGSSELEFTVPEVSLLFAGEIDEVQAAQFKEMTGGWPVALWYARNNRENFTELRDAVAAGDLAYLPSDLSEFIDEQLVSRLSGEVRDLLVNMSIFYRFNIKQVGYVCGMTDAASLMSRIHLAPFIFAVDDKTGHFQFNSIFREYLHRKLSFCADEKVTTLHQRAADWFERNGKLYEAIFHAKQAGDVGRMLVIFCSAGGVEIGLREGTKQLERLVALFPLEVRERDSQLLLSRALLYMKDGKLDLGQRFLDRAHQEMKASTPDASLEYYESIVAMLLAVYEDSHVSLVEIAEFEDRAKQLMPERFWSQGWFNNLLCMMYYAVGEMNGAKKAASVALEFYRVSGAVYSQVFIHIHLGLIHSIQGNIAAARTELDAARALCQEHFSPDAGLTAIVHVLIAEIAYEQGEDDMARQLIAGALERVEQHEGWVEVFIRGYVTASNLAFAGGSLEDAIDILEHGNLVAQGRNLPRLARITDIQKLELLTVAGDHSGAYSIVEALSLEDFLFMPEPIQVGNFQESYRIVHALSRFGIENGYAEAALQLLEPVITEQQQFGHVSFLIKSQVLKTLALVKLDRIDLSDQVFHTLVEQTCTHDYIMSYLSEGKPLKKYVSGFIKRRTLSKLPGEQVAFLGRILADRNAPETEAGGTNILSPKEFEVLKNVSAGYPNKVIGRSMNLTETTVKFHLRNIFTKLGVRNRLMAVEVARAKNIIP
ncbi:MAG: LuxR C-terminal-related transcriptional regulator [Haliea sp.]